MAKNIFTTLSKKTKDPIKHKMLTVYRRRELKQFKNDFINSNRGTTLYLVRCEDVSGGTINDFTNLIHRYIKEIRSSLEDFGKSFTIEHDNHLFIGLAPLIGSEFSNIDGILGRIHKTINSGDKFKFSYGIGRTQCNFVSNQEEIYEALFVMSQKNLEENLRRWSWTRFNKVQHYFAKSQNAAVIQPIIKFDHKKELYSMIGGEVFVGGDIYDTFYGLYRDIPLDQNYHRIELLVLEKLIQQCKGAPGLLKFNISPQALLKTFNTQQKVKRFYEMIKSVKLDPKKIRIELIEQPYIETTITLKKVCEYFWYYGISFAADDFGVKSQSHQVILDLGEMIKEFKLDPMSFKFKEDEHHTKFLDNLAFIDYCKRLADNREAMITAEAVTNYDSLRFLIAHQIYYFQTNLFVEKISLEEYTNNFDLMQNLPETSMHAILTSNDLIAKQKSIGNIFTLAKSLNLLN